MVVTRSDQYQFRHMLRGGPLTRLLDGCPWLPYWCSSSGNGPTVGPSSSVRFVWWRPFRGCSSATSRTSYQWRSSFLDSRRSNTEVNPIAKVPPLASLSIKAVQPEVEKACMPHWIHWPLRVEIPQTSAKKQRKGSAIQGVLMKALRRLSCIR